MQCNCAEDLHFSAFHFLWNEGSDFLSSPVLFFLGFFTVCMYMLDVYIIIILPFLSVPERLCLEDYIALQEIIVPIVVGGVLGILLVLIFIAYVIAYARRRRREAKYEPVGDY